MYFLPFFFFSIKLHFFLYRRWNQTRLISVQLEEEKRSLSGKARSKPLAVITAIPSNELWGRHVKRSLSGHEARFQWKSYGPGVTYAGERERRRRRRRRWRRQPRRYQLKPARAFSARGKSVAETASSLFPFRASSSISRRTLRSTIEPRISSIDTQTRLIGINNLRQFFQNVCWFNKERRVESQWLKVSWSEKGKVNWAIG